MRKQLIPIAALPLLLLPAFAHAQEARRDSARAGADSLIAFELSEVESLPELKDRGRAARSIDRYYPPALLQAGRGGTVVVRARIDEQGVPGQFHVETSSGLVDIDRAALLVLAELRFTPARIGGRAAPVWVFMPIVFQAPPRRVVPLDSIGIP